MITTYCWDDYVHGHTFATMGLGISGPAIANPS